MEEAIGEELRPLCENAEAVRRLVSHPWLVEQANAIATENDAITCSKWYKTYLGDCFRRWKARLGTPKAITAMAHKLARTLWHLLKYREAYDPKVWMAAEEKLRTKKLKRLYQNATALGYKLVMAA